MRERVLKLVITFHTTAHAMAMEQGCRERNLPGRLIPVPRAISAGCGISWCADISDRQALEGFLKDSQIEAEGVYETLV
ncbi:DUF3343 domain-containing protein [Lactonifactor longoviformis]|uniref:Putative Se/S carrier protein-like domain-containing protein n=1 Tax=Lactonifactor longoviformis DSM 17459 TaxID=1122155 RepID=A0A1M4T5M8_9CLOT|nr:DUF3343 domain-containing protein [Lactonifactor longoviformis]POP34593.1 DUF3343 domain-containing protein [Lactonifactor longoviformis]SHE39694.1 Protein of unknown function [Lactonifactor longoviformis DSM 17459]